MDFSPASKQPADAPSLPVAVAPDASASQETTPHAVLPNTASPDPSPNNPRPPVYRFPRRNILHNKAILRAALDSGPRIHHHYFTCIYVSYTPDSSSPVTLVTFLVSKKCGHAVMRNRLKRIFREAWRHIPQYHPENKIIIWLIKPTAQNLSLHEIQNCMTTTLRSL